MKTLLGALAILAVAACHDATGPGVTLDNAEGRWNQANISNYMFTVKVNCFCGHTAPIRVTVQDDVPVQVVFADSTSVAADTTAYHEFLTIDRIFDVLRSSLQQNPATFTADYDGATGYPRSVSIDPQKTVADDELGIQITSFVTTTP